jgi:hypothetical protein
MRRHLHRARDDRNLRRELGWPFCRTCFASFRGNMEKRGMICQSLPQQRVAVCYRNVTGQVIVER